MRKIKGRMDESILVCAYYGPNGERLIKRGHKLATLLDCPLYVLTVDPLPYDKFDADKSSYVDRWKELAEELDVEAFFLRDNERRPSAKVIAEVAYDLNITQIIIGQTPQNRWEEITKGSFANALLREITFIDVHIVSVDRTIKGAEDTTFEKGVLGYLRKDGDNYRLSFASSVDNHYEGIFYKEIGTDFNNGIFKFVRDGKTYQVHVEDDRITDQIQTPPNYKQ
ncbi:universal stress protein [Virgibacillus soli]|uniref:Universal stress protein n=1 Tax=Paracerasibacillus soli TaxID=480284 RepID=A0ABU5CWA1_9BACI|nr:universal stress protein [Virgibacillus soli]MDY0410112.1 universal stress protein [Virgibacillus soli]